MSCSTEAVEKYTHSGERGAGSVAAALLLHCAFPAALCGTAGWEWPEQYSSVCRGWRFEVACSFPSGWPLLPGLVSFCERCPRTPGGRSPGAVTAGWQGWFLLLRFALPPPFPGRPHQLKHVAWARGTFPPSVLPAPDHLLGTGPFLGTGSWFCFLPT